MHLRSKGREGEREGGTKGGRKEGNRKKEREKKRERKGGRKAWFIDFLNSALGSVLLVYWEQGENGKAT